MKRCPECRRDYYDETLLYCLDDGNALLEGPASTDEPQTAILHATDAVDDVLTRRQIGETGRSAILPQGTGAAVQRPRAFDKRLTAVPLLALLIAVGGYFGYRYLEPFGSKQISSIAVMPFENATGSGDLEYLADGVTESLINSLSQISGLSVKARSSVFRYKGKDIEPQQVGSDLKVQVVMNGRVFQRAENLTISLDLVDAATGNQIWGEQYSRKSGDLAALQTEIARDVSHKLRSKLSGDEVQRVGKNYTENNEAYRLYLQGRYFWNKRTIEGFRQAIAHFEQALAIDPNYALAYSGLSDSEALLSVYQGANPKDAMPKAKVAALKAISLDPNLAEAHASLGQVLQTYDYDFAGAEREFKRAIELSPNYATAHQWYAELLTQVGRFDEAFASIDRAISLDPFNLVINRENGGLRCYARRYDQCIELLKKGLTLDPNFSGFYYDLSWAYQMKGDHQGSAEAFAKWRELSGDAAGAAVARASFAKGGWRGFAKAVTDRNSGIAALKAYNTGAFFIALGDNDAAISEFFKAYDERINDVYWMKVDPRLDPVRSDPRFQALLKKVNFPE